MVFFLASCPCLTFTLAALARLLATLARLHFHRSLSNAADDFLHCNSAATSASQLQCCRCTEMHCNVLKLHWSTLRCKKLTRISRTHSYTVHILHSARSHLVHFAHFAQCTLRFCPFYTFCRVREQAGEEYWPTLSHLILFAVNPLHLTSAALNNSAALNCDRSISRP